VAAERATEPGGGWEPVGASSNLFLEQGMRERMPADAERRGSDSGREPARAIGHVDGRRAPLVVIERDADVMPRAHREQSIRRRLTWTSFAQVDADAWLRRFRERMVRGVERTPAGVRLGLLLIVGLVAVTISQVEYSVVRAERDRALRQAAAETRVVRELRHANSMLVRERETARRDVDAAAHALDDATTDLRRWRRIAISRERHPSRSRRHR
jgi:hypothetical protein